MSDLHERCSAEVARRRALAEAAAVFNDGPWKRETGTGYYVTSNRDIIVARGVHSNTAADLIAANDPADTLRRCDHTDDVLARHRRCGVECREVVALAKSWGIE